MRDESDNLMGRVDEIRWCEKKKREAPACLCHLIYVELRIEDGDSLITYVFRGGRGRE
jgi:hypothetical protein